MISYRFHFPLTIFLTIILSFCTSHVRAQSNNDEEEIRQVIDNYIVGWRTADSVLLSKAFDLEAGVVLWVSRNSAPEKLNSMTLNQLVNRNKVQESYGVGYVIEELKVIGSQLAIAMVKIPTKKAYYIDCLELQKINDTWKIVLKSYVYFPNE